MVFKNSSFTRLLLVLSISGFGASSPVHAEDTDHAAPPADTNKAAGEKAQEMTSSEEHRNSEVQGDAFKQFAKNFATFYSCQNPSSADWYMKRVFEQLKYTMAQNSSIRQVPDDVSDQIVAAMKANMNEGADDAYLKRVADFARDMSKKILAAKRSPAAGDKKFWSSSLGGGKGTLQKIDPVNSGSPDPNALISRWNATSANSLFHPQPKPDITKLCKDPKVMAQLRAHATKIRKDEKGYDTKAGEDSAAMLDDQDKTTAAAAQKVPQEYREELDKKPTVLPDEVKAAQDQKVEAQRTEAEAAQRQTDAAVEKAQTDQSFVEAKKTMALHRDNALTTTDNTAGIGMDETMREISTAASSTSDSAQATAIAAQAARLVRVTKSRMQALRGTLSPTEYQRQVDALVQRTQEKLVKLKALIPTDDALPAEELASPGEGRTP